MFFLQKNWNMSNWWLQFWKIFPYLGGFGEGEGMPTQAIWAQGDYVKISFEIDQNFPSIEMISFVFFDIS